MEINDRKNKKISELLIALHHGANVVNQNEFRSFALDLVNSVIPFDSASWGKHSLTDNEPAATKTNMHYQPDELSQNLECIRKFEEWLKSSKVVQPWITVNFNHASPPGALTPELHHNFDSSGFKHCLYTIGCDPFTQSPHHITLFRNDIHRPYSENERLLKQLLMPHLEASCDHNQRLLPQSSNHNGHDSERRHSNALADNEGVLFATEPRFNQYLRAEFQDWHGPLLPEPLIKSFIEQNKNRHVGNSVTLSSCWRGSMRLLWARPKQPIDELSPHIITLATHFAEGYNHKEIGQMMNISPATVRNHISVIYKKLQINNKYQLAQLLSAIRQPRMRG
jgi:Bacterial regulatory proteins, luxR family